MIEENKLTSAGYSTRIGLSFTVALNRIADGPGSADECDASGKREVGCQKDSAQAYVLRADGEVRGEMIYTFISAGWLAAVYGETQEFVRLLHITGYAGCNLVMFRLRQSLNILRNAVSVSMGSLE